MNSKGQGNIGLVRAINYFGSAGYTVSVPLNDSQPYDLIIDDGLRLQRVSVRTCRYQRKGRWQVGIDTKGGNQSFHTIKSFDKTKVEILFVLTQDGKQWVIPSSEIEAKHGLVLGEKWKQWVSVHDGEWS